MNITLAHGGGGRETSSLIHDIITKHLGNPELDRLEDAAVIKHSGKTVFTTDSFTVKPLFFPGGDIGKLAVCGTVNDIAMRGGVCTHLSLGLIIEEGFPVEDFENIIKSIGEQCNEQGILVACGDTKVVEKGNADGLYINTSGIGTLRDSADVSVANARPGDAVLVNGPVGEHGAAILGARNELGFTSDLVSDCAPLTSLAGALLESGAGVHVMRDATRGGLAAVINEIGEGSGVTLVLEEKDVPVSEKVKGVCSILGMDPLTLANEGKLVAVVSGADTEKALAAMKSHPLGKEAAVIGTVEEKGNVSAILTTSLGVRNILEMPRGELLPRIC